jgi:hypothetical protein
VEAAGLRLGLGVRRLERSRKGEAAGSRRLIAADEGALEGSRGAGVRMAEHCGWLLLLGPGLSAKLWGEAERSDFDF